MAWRFDLQARAAAMAAALTVLGAQSAHAQLFGGDDQARRAILELRQKVDANRQATDAADQRLGEELQIGRAHV